MFVVFSLTQIVFGSGLKKMWKRYNTGREITEILDVFICYKEGSQCLLQSLK